MFREEVDRAITTVPDLPIVNQPGVNEELAATAVMGSQLTVNFDDCKYDGVMGMWYGKGPGIDRAGDAIRHAVFAGTAPHGGVVAVVGDDPAAKSSTLPSSSDATMVDLHMPLLFPGDTQEALDLARHAIALSRACGLWAGLKLTSPIADGTGTVDVAVDRVVPHIPIADFDGKPFRPHPNGRLITPYTIDMEREFHEVRTDLARQYGALNRLNRVTVRSADDWIGIAACGHTYHEVREALQVLGFADERRPPRGRDPTVPVDDAAPARPPRRARVRRRPRRRARDRGEERHARAARPRRPVRQSPNGRVCGASATPTARWSCPTTGCSTPTASSPRCGSISAPRLGDRLAPERQHPDRNLIPLSVDRAPYFCSGCPHNTSTRVEPGTLVGGGIGCHAMVALMDPDRAGDVVALTCMGNEGAQWIGMAPFIERQHLVQNLGDGTYFHSGSLAIRAAVAAGVDITYKLLYNGTVAMTGGQDAPGGRRRPRRHPDAARRRRRPRDRHHRRPRSIRRRHVPEGRRGVGPLPGRRGTDACCAATKGTTVLIHDQRCAAEKRRDRTRGLHRPTRVPGRHQRTHLRGLWRLRRQVELPVGAADRHAVRAQDDDPPDELQLRLLVHARRLPLVRHRHRRHGQRRRPEAEGRPPSRPSRRRSRRRCRSSTATASRCGCPASAARA